MKQSISTIFQLNNSGVGDFTIYGICLPIIDGQEVSIADKMRSVIDEENLGGNLYRRFVVDGAPVLEISRMPNVELISLWVNLREATKDEPTPDR